jgi:hypothetical protein
VSAEGHYLAVLVTPMADRLTVTPKGEAWHRFRQGIFRRFVALPANVQNDADDAWMNGWNAGFAAGRVDSEVAEAWQAGWDQGFRDYRAGTVDGDGDRVITPTPNPHALSIHKQQCEES